METAQGGFRALYQDIVAPGKSLRELLVRICKFRGSTTCPICGHSLSNYLAGGYWSGAMLSSSPVERAVADLDCPYCGGPISLLYLLDGKYIHLGLLTPKALDLEFDLQSKMCEERWKLTAE